VDATVQIMHSATVSFSLSLCTLSTLNPALPLTGRDKQLIVVGADDWQQQHVASGAMHGALRVQAQLQHL